MICCALPVLLVALGAGAVLAGLVTAVPQIVTLSEHRLAVFAVAGALLVLAGAARFAARNAPCPNDPEAADACRRLRHAGGLLLVGSATIYLIGLFFAYVAPALLV